MPRWSRDGPPCGHRPALRWAARRTPGPPPGGPSRLSAFDCEVSMHRCVPRLILAVGLLLALPLPAAHAQSLLFDYLGFDYESPNPDSTQFGEPGSGYVGLGTVPGLFSPLVADTAANQYTYVITGLVSSSRTPFSNYFVVDYGSGTLSIYEESQSTATSAGFGASPLNPQ